MTTTRSIHRILPVLGLILVLAAAQNAVVAADGDSKQPTVATPGYPLTTCVVCEKALKDGETKTTMHEKREMKCCSDACAMAIKDKPEYYKGVYDGAARARSSHGPKGGETGKGADSQR